MELGQGKQAVLVESIVLREAQKVIQSIQNEQESAGQNIMMIWKMGLVSM